MNLRKIYTKYPGQIGVISVILLIAMLLYLALVFDKEKFFGKEYLTIAMPKVGSYKQVMEVLKLQLLHGGKINLKIDTLESAGSIKTIQLLVNGFVDMGLIQGDIYVEFPEEDLQHIRSVLQLYREVFFFFTTDRSVQTVEDFCAKFTGLNTFLRVASLGVGSQTHHDLYVILRDYCNIPEKQILHATMEYPEIKDALLHRKVDAGFFIASKENETIKELAAEDTVVKLLSFRDRKKLYKYDTMEEKALHDFKLDAAGLGNGYPKQDVQTISTPALLVVAEKLNAGKVYDLTTSIWDNKEALKGKQKDLEITEITDTNFRFKVHEGARRVFEKKDVFSFFAKHIDLFKFITPIIAILITTLSLCFQVWIHLKQNKVTK